MPMLFLILRPAIVRLHEVGNHGAASRLAFHVPFYYLLLLLLGSVSLDTPSIYAAAVVAAMFEVEVALLVTGGVVDIAVIIASVVGTATAATVCTEVSRGALALVPTVSREQFRRARLGRYFSPELAARVEDRPEGTGGESRDVTILFSDLRDFTALRAAAAHGNRHPHRNGRRRNHRGVPPP